MSLISHRRLGRRFVRCIKSNGDMVPKKVDRDMVFEQLVSSVSNQHTYSAADICPRVS